MGMGNSQKKSNGSALGFEATLWAMRQARRRINCGWNKAKAI
jgi:hypothetical protein